MKRFQTFGHVFASLNDFWSKFVFCMKTKRQKFASSSASTNLELVNEKVAKEK